MFRIVAIVFLFFMTKVHSQDWRMGSYHHPWSDSVLNTLDLKECIAQTMMIPSWSNKGSSHIRQVEELIVRHKVGGIIFFQGDPLSQAYLTNYYQQNSRVPLFIGIDGEWGLAMRLTNMKRFPYQMTMGAMDNDYLLHNVGYSIGEQCKRLGVHINFAPVVDVNTNENNPIIGFRSFGDNKNKVAQKAGILMQGMQAAGILACAKHFPGHGDTKFDSHLGLPKLSHSKERFNNVELVPFKKIIDNGVKSIMVAHLSIPSLESNSLVPSSLSPKVVNNLLKQELGFKGLVITDALNMGGVKKNYKPGYAELAAIKAGNDILCFPENVPKAIALIYSAILRNELDSNEIRERARKVLYFKRQAGLNQEVYIKTANLESNLSKLYPNAMLDEVASSSITIARDHSHLLPLDTLKKIRTAVWQIGKYNKASWRSELDKYEKVSHFFTNKKSNWTLFEKKIQFIRSHFDRVIISVHDQAIWGSSSRKLPVNVYRAIKAMDASMPTIPVLFGQPYVLSGLQTVKCALVAYEELPNFYSSTAKIIYGIEAAVGVLPVSVGSQFISGEGVLTNRKAGLFPNSTWKKEGFKYDFSNKVQKVLDYCVNIKAAPGGQVLVLRNGKVVLDKSFGKLSYEGDAQVNSNHLYDIASITKIASTTLAAMKLYEEGRLNLDARLAEYLPEARNTNKANIRLRSMLMHDAGLEGWIPFYRNAIVKGGVFSPIPDSTFNLQICNNAYMPRSYQDQMWSDIWESKTKPPGRYLYSDLGMILLQRCIERITGMGLDEYINRTFYKPMRLNHIGYNPAKRFSIDRFAPTMDDLGMRYGIVRGFVHDPASSMLGGVAGHAGVFSNAHDLACIMQMLLSKGTFNGIQYLKPETVDYFTMKQRYGSRRGLGFDRINGRTGSRSNVAAGASYRTFGHSGFTGTWAWCDPKENLVFIMLTNRTYPNQENKKLVKYAIRTKVLQAVYNAIP